MPKIKISKELSSGIFFLTFTVRNWYQVLGRYDRFEILADSLTYCQKHKGLKIYAYVFMLNHIHLIASAPDMIAFVRDFKKFTSNEMRKNISALDPVSLPLFLSEGRWNFWQNTNMPKHVESDKYLLQKINYIHNNPVRKLYVPNPEDWAWSSANPESVIRIESLNV